MDSSSGEELEPMTPSDKEKSPSAPREYPPPKASSINISDDDDFQERVNKIRQGWAEIKADKGRIPAPKGFTERCQASIRRKRNSSSSSEYSDSRGGPSTSTPNPRRPIDSTKYRLVKPAEEEREKGRKMDIESQKKDRKNKKLEKPSKLRLEDDGDDSDDSDGGGAGTWKSWESQRGMDKASRGSNSRRDAGIDFSRPRPSQRSSELSRLRDTSRSRSRDQPKSSGSIRKKIAESQVDIPAEEYTSKELNDKWDRLTSKWVMPKPNGGPSTPPPAPDPILRDLSPSDASDHEEPTDDDDLDADIAGYFGPDSDDESLPDSEKSSLSPPPRKRKRRMVEEQEPRRETSNDDSDEPISDDDDDEMSLGSLPSRVSKEPVSKKKPTSSGASRPILSRITGDWDEPADKSTFSEAAKTPKQGVKRPTMTDFFKPTPRPGQERRVPDQPPHRDPEGFKAAAKAATERLRAAPTVAKPLQVAGSSGTAPKPLKRPERAAPKPLHRPEQSAPKPHHRSEKAAPKPLHRPEQSAPKPHYRPEKAAPKPHQTHGTSGTAPKSHHRSEHAATKPPRQPDHPAPKPHQTHGGFGTAPKPHHRPELAAPKPPRQPKHAAPKLHHRSDQAAPKPHHRSEHTTPKHRAPAPIVPKTEIFSDDDEFLDPEDPYSPPSPDPNMTAQSVAKVRAVNRKHADTLQSKIEQKTRRLLLMHDEMDKKRVVDEEYSRKQEREKRRREAEEEERRLKNPARVPKFICHTCGRHHANQKKLEEHKHSHSDNVQAVCPMCFTEIKFKYNLKQHMTKCQERLKQKMGNKGVAEYYPEFAKAMKIAARDPGLDFPPLPYGFVMLDDGVVVGHDPMLDVHTSLLLKSFREEGAAMASKETSKANTKKPGKKNKHNSDDSSDDNNASNDNDQPEPSTPTTRSRGRGRGRGAGSGVSVARGAGRGARGARGGGRGGRGGAKAVLPLEEESEQGSDEDISEF